MAQDEGTVFISYRRDDTAWPAARLYDQLAARLGPERVFKDVDNIEPGEDFVTTIISAVNRADTLFALIGKDWAGSDGAGHRRLDDPKDFVRLEVATALDAGIRVVPILVDGAGMPGESELPPDLRPLVRRQPVEISAVRLNLDRLLGATGEATPPARSRSGRRAGRRPVVVVVLMGAGVVLAAVAGTLTVLNRPSELVSPTTVPSSASAAPRTSPATGIRVLDTIGIPKGASGVALDVAVGRMFLARDSDNVVSVVSADNGSVVGTVRVGDGPWGVALDPVAGQVWVANRRAGSVSVISAATLEPLGDVMVGAMPYALAVAPGLNRAYVANSMDGTVSVVDTGSRQVVDEIIVGTNPYAVAVDESLQRVYVAVVTDDVVAVIDTQTNTVVEQIKTGREPRGLAIDSATRRLYVANAADDTVIVVDTVTNELMDTIRVGTEPRALAVDPAARLLYVPSATDGTLQVVNTGSGEVTTLAAGFAPQGVVADTDAHTAYLVDPTGEVRVIGR